MQWVMHITTSIQMKRPVRGDQSSHNERNILGAAVGAIAMATIGFSQLGWTTSGKAEMFAQERANIAVVAALVPFCIAKAQQDPDKVIYAKLQAETSSYSRSDMVMKGGVGICGRS